MPAEFALKAHDTTASVPVKQGVIPYSLRHPVS